MNRGVAQSLICPRCGQSHPPTGDRALVTCIKCALVFTVDAGSRDQKPELRAVLERRAEAHHRTQLDNLDERVRDLVISATESPTLDLQQVRRSLDVGDSKLHPLVELVGAICERATLRGAVATRVVLTAHQDRVEDLVDGEWIGEDLDSRIGGRLVETLFAMMGYPDRLIEHSNELVLHRSQRHERRWGATVTDVPGGHVVLIAPLARHSED